MTKVKVLIITPKITLPGGVSEFNRMLFHYSENDLTPFFLSSVGNLGSNYYKGVLTIFDYFKFMLILITKYFDIVHVNPSLGKNALFRDSIFVWLAKLFRKKIFIHWHGWNPENEYLLDKHNNFLKNTMFKADHIRFLALSFQTKFIKKGFKNETSLGNTFIDDELLKFKSITDRSHKIFNILFLSTISKNKGIHLALDTYKIVKNKYPLVKLTIAGTGEELQTIKNRIRLEQIEDVGFKGYVNGDVKSECYQEADIYLFPSFYEGMPTSVIEAMGFGLPVICSEVGALSEFFENEKMGYRIKNFDKKEYFLAIEKILINPRNSSKIGDYNKAFVEKVFIASKSVSRIDNLYEKLL